MNSEITQNNVTAAKSIRLLRPSVVVLCGPAACGKSTFAEKHFRPTQIISSDAARAQVCDDERDQRFNAQAFALVHFLVDQRLTLNRLCVVDSTALTPQSRKELLDLARKYQVPTTLILFNVPCETCVQRDEKRARTVGRATIERQCQAFEQAKATIHQEGFDQVIELQDGDLQNLQIEILFRPVARPAQRPDGGATRRFERPAQPSRPRPTTPGGNGHSHPVNAPPAAAPRPATAPAPDSALTTAAPRAPETTPPAVTSPTAVAPPLPVAQPPAKVIKPNVAGPPVASPRPEPPMARPPVPVRAQPSGGS